MIKLTPFKRLLIANRSEIALRIMRTAKQMGLTTLAVFAKEEANAKHVSEADEAYCIGESYLSIDKIIEAAKILKAEAVHPGYGFLAENAEFAQKCLDSGLIFVGPSPKAIKAMGDKAEAKALMKKAGVPCIEGFEGAQDEAGLLKASEKIGFPVMIKAVAGGGGRGIRLVENAKEFSKNLSAAKNEALNAFGDDTVLIEKAIINPKHIEIQVIADRYGNAIHAGERDCSVQRRNQKLIEEAPSLAISPKLREKMGEIVVKATKAIKYEGVGTFEFLLDEQQNFYFMEMNTRLQVEHPVTEMITGLDLVELQLKIASGEALQLAQKDVKYKGHSIEVRFCAEDPYNNFLPQSGELVFHAPKNLRVETALTQNAIISPNFDSMIAKFISYGETRLEAIENLSNALKEMAIFGLKTNQTFLINALNHPVFKNGTATTAFIENEKDVLLTKPSVTPSLVSLAAALFSLAPLSPLTPRFKMPLKLKAEGEAFNVAVHYENAKISVENQGNITKYECLEQFANGALLKINDVQQRLIFQTLDNTLYIVQNGYTYHFNDVTFEAKTSENAALNANEIKAVMNGKIVEIHKKAGDACVKGEVILTLEAMKMQHHHVSNKTGKIKSVLASLNEQVSLNQVLVELED